MKKPVSILTALLLTAQLALPISATQTITYDSTQNEESSSYQTVGVSAEAAEIYAVTLPKEVTLEVSKEKANFEYEVTVTGEVASNHYVRVIPMDDAKISDEEEIRVFDLAVTQDKKRWEYTELDGSVRASGEYMVVETVDGVETPVILEPGKYYGKVKYYITCDDAGLWEPATCTSPATCSGYDINDNGVLDWGEDANHNYTLDDGEDLDGDAVLDSEYLAVPVTKGVALGHNFADGDTAFPATCTRCKNIVYAIRTPEQLTAFKDAVNAGTPYTNIEIVLNNDIDMSGVTWTSGIGAHNSGNFFAGTFNGYGHKISNLTVDWSGSVAGGGFVATKGYGLFGGAYNTPVTVKNFVLEDANFKYAFRAESSSPKINAGFIMGYDCAESTFENVHVRGGTFKITSEGAESANLYFGGIVGSGVDSTIKDCSIVDAQVQINTPAYAVEIGGVLEYSNGSTIPTVSNCLVAYDILVESSKSLVQQPFMGSESSNTQTVFTNCVWDSSRFSFFDNNRYPQTEYLPTNGLNGTTAEVQTQAAVDILNTGHTVPLWKMDLEGINNGYPITK